MAIEQRKWCTCAWCDRVWAQQRCAVVSATRGNLVAARDKCVGRRVWQGAVLEKKKAQTVTLPPWNHRIISTRVHGEPRFYSTWSFWYPVALEDIHAPFVQGNRYVRVLVRVGLVP